MSQQDIDIAFEAILAEEDGNVELAKELASLLIEQTNEEDNA